MKNMLSHKGYFGSVEFSDEDDIFHGRIIGINDHITYEGNSVKSLRRDFVSAVDEYLSACAELGKEPEKAYRGTLNLRIEPTLHKQLTAYSLSQGKSLNTTVEEAISKYIH